MKKIKLLLVITFTFLFSTTSWGEWSYVVESVEDNKFYYDKDRLRKSGKYLYFWELIDRPKPNEFGNLSSTTYVQLDCSIFRFKNLKYQSYKDSMGEGERTSDWTPKDEWRYPQPKSTFEYMYNKVCEEHQKNYVSLEVKKRGVFYIGERNGKFGFYTEKWEGLETEDNMDYVKYEGDTVKGVPNGQGTFTFPDGKKYEGKFKDGKEHGKGTYTYPNGSVYVGEFKDGKKHGQGKETYPDGKYVGEFKDGKYNGQGRLTTSIGNYFEGEWKDGEMWNGTLTNKNGKIRQKIVNGEDVEP